MSDEQLQNDPDRAGGLITGGQGEFAGEDPGGAFDPRTFREGGAAPATGADEEDVDDPPVNDERMSGPGEEIDKAG
jgi:hypothetical protein